MQTKKHLFTERFFQDWLPSFCYSQNRNLTPEAFVPDNLKNLSEHDAAWFLRAVDSANVQESNGYFLSDRSHAKEQIMWQGRKADIPRKSFLWLEPIITIGALARLIHQYNWPQDQVGLQSVAPWPFDLMGYAADNETERLACEVKKSSTEISRLIAEMTRFGAMPALEEEPANPTLRNAYRKVVGIRRGWPSLFWALGPNDEGELFKVMREPDGEIFSLIPLPEDALIYQDP